MDKRITDCIIEVGCIDEINEAFIIFHEKAQGYPTPLFVQSFLNFYETRRWKGALI